MCCYNWIVERKTNLNIILSFCNFILMLEAATVVCANEINMDV